MRKILLLICALSLLFSCQKKRAWDEKLNGIWDEVDPITNSKKLKTSPENGVTLEFNNHYMTFSQWGSTHNINTDNSKLIAYKSQIYNFTKMDIIRFSKSKYSYKYDYEFDGDYLWIRADGSSAISVVKGSTNSIKLVKH